MLRSVSCGACNVMTGWSRPWWQCHRVPRALSLHNPTCSALSDPGDWGRQQALGPTVPRGRMRGNTQSRAGSQGASSTF